MKEIELLKAILLEQQKTNQLLAMLIEALGQEEAQPMQTDMDGNPCLPSASR